MSTRGLIKEACKRRGSPHVRLWTKHSALVVALLLASPLIAQHHVDIKAVGEAPHYAAQQLLPVQLSLGGESATIVDLQFCGSNGGDGSMIAIIVPGIAKPVLTLDASSCGQSAESIAKAFLASHSDAKWVAVDYAVASWSNFRMSISSGKSVVYLRDLSKDSIRTKDLEEAGNLLSVQTDSLTVTSEGYSLSMLGRVWFASDGIIVSFFPVESRQAALQAAIPTFVQTPGGVTDSVLKMSYDDANYFNQKLSPTGNDVSTPAGIIHISNIAITGTENSLKVTGQVASPQFPPFDATISTDGEDLAIDDISVQPGFSCDGKRGLALLQCRAQRTAASSAGDAIAHRLTVLYKGRSLRPTGQEATNKISLGGKNFLLHTYLVKVHASNDGLYLLGSMSVEAH